MATLTKSELIKYLESLKVVGNTFIGITYVNPNPSELRKTAVLGEKVVFPYWNTAKDKGATKTTSTVCMMGSDYNTRVNNLATREGKEERETNSLPYGQWLGDSGLFIITDKGDIQLRLYPAKNSTPKVSWTVTETGEDLDEDFMELFLYRNDTKSSVQADLDGEVMPRNFSVKKIQRISINGIKWDIVD